MSFLTFARKGTPFVLSKPRWTLQSRLATSLTSQNEVIRLPTNEDSSELLRIRHTAAHVMAMSVQKLFPSMQVAIGPWIDNGFYYDFFSPTNQTLSDEDLKTIKKGMIDIIKKDMPLVSHSFCVCCVCV
jgi:threonyl-tRNA synthetase